MKHIHLVTPYQSAAMRRMYEPLKNELAKLYEITASAEADETADLNYHIPWHTLAGFEKTGTGKHAIAYTHCNVGGEAALMDACERADLITCMTFTGRKELVDMGVDPAKLWVIYSAADQFIFRKRLIGIIGYPQPNGRKREGLLLDLAWNYDMTPFQFVFLGTGWEDTVSKLQSLNVSASSYDAQSDEELRPFYHQIDLFLVTGYREGGPLPLLEAMASGADVLSPRFGYASDLLKDEQIYDSLEDLADKLESYAAPYVNRHKLARAWRWQDYCSEHALLFGRMLGESVDLYPEFGVSRYAQLLDEIDGLRPREIVEIGTWNGSRAIQMIQQVAKYVPINEISYQGFDLFESQTGEQYRRELSKQGWDIEIVEKRIKATGANVYLIEGKTKETLENIDSSDFYFVDGGHSEATIKNDGDYIIEYMRKNSIAIFDDYYHAGKPAGMGCNRFIDTLNKSLFEITHLPVRTKTDDGREIGMVKVQRKNADLSLQRQETLTESFTQYAGKPRDIVSEMQLTDAQSTASC